MSINRTQSYTNNKQGSNQKLQYNVKFINAILRARQPQYKFLTRIVFTIN